MEKSSGKNMERKAREDEDEDKEEEKKEERKKTKRTKNGGQHKRIKNQSKTHKKMRSIYLFQTNQDN